MKINIITTIEIEENIITKEVRDKIYSEFRDIIKEVNESHDLMNFLFINADTETEIENEIEE